jgi:hypothetical protein
MRWLCKLLCRAALCLALSAILCGATTAEGITVSKSVSTGESFGTTALIVPGGKLAVRVDCSLPDDVDDLDGCRYAITDELVPALTLHTETVQVSLVTPTGIAYDLTDAFQAYLGEDALRVQCDALREALPRAMVPESIVRLEYEYVIEGDAIEGFLPSTTSAHVTLTPAAGSAETLSSGSSQASVKTLAMEVSVCGPAGEAIVDAAVALATDDGIVLRAVSGEGGKALFTGVPQGSSVVKVDCDGMISEAALSILPDGDGVDVKVSSAFVTDARVQDGATVLLTMQSRSDVIPSEPNVTVTPVMGAAVALATIGMLALLWLTSPHDL